VVLKYLKEILISKKEEIKKIKEGPGLMGSGPVKARKNRRSFLDNIGSRKVNVIAEIKRASPSMGIINSQLDLRETALAYNSFKSFVCGISVLTESLYFKGSLEDIKVVKENSDLPVLRKDFIFNNSQIHQSAAIGVDCILLIATLLGKKKLNKLYNLAVNLGLEVLVEIHGLKDLEKALATGARLIGINNRDLRDMNVDRNTILRFLDHRQKMSIKNRIFICESGVVDIEYIKGLFLKGISTFLIGSYFMNSRDLRGTLKNMEFGLREKKLI
jgi:indole-3-glycerol phosphate synthase